MARRKGETIRIGDDIEIRLLTIKGSQVKLGISVPRHIPVDVTEVHLATAENMATVELPEAATATFTKVFQKTLLPKGPPLKFQGYGELHRKGRLHPPPKT